MKNVEFNSRYWDGLYDWKGAGEEWSEMWGGSRAQWLGSLYPRISIFLPAKHILEIAPGFGRWTQFLLSACENFQGVDLSQECVDACKVRFAHMDKVKFYKNDGSSLECAEEGVIDFIFSFDSLVHANAEVLAAYVPEIMRVLAPNGVAFIHHSNWLEIDDGEDNPHGRGADVSADMVADMVKRTGGHLLIQEKINWGGPKCTDCLTLFGKRQGRTVRIENTEYMNEGNSIRKYQSPYSMIGRG